MVSTFKIQMAALAVSAFVAIQPAHGFTGWADPFPYMARDANLDLVLREFSSKTGLSIKTYETLGEQVSIDNADASIKDFLDRITIMNGLSWWTDGVAIHIERNQSSRMEAIPSNGIPLAHFEKEIGGMGINIERFPPRQSSDRTMVFVTGTDEYVRTVASLISSIVTHHPQTTLPVLVVGTTVRP